MTIRPIIFSGPMIQALLAGRKTMTRRVLKKLPVLHLPVESRYRPGDMLWVRESFHGPASPDAKPPWAIYRADGENADIGWRSPIYMPRRWSRLTLEVTAVKTERLQEISEEDAVAEGVEETGPPATAVECFSKLWNTIHGPGSWEINPFVVAITFRVHKHNIDTEELT